MAVGNFKGDETPDNNFVSTCESSRNFMNIGQNSNPTLLTISESEESKGPGRGMGKQYTSEYPPNQLGRPSLSESTTGPTKQFNEPGFDKRSSRTKHAPSQGGGVDDENFFEDTEDPTDEAAAGNKMIESIDSGQARDGYFDAKSNKEAAYVDGFQVARNNQEDQSDSSENENSYTSGGKRKEKKANVEKVPRKSIRKKPDKVPKGDKPAGVDKKRFGSQEKMPLMD